ncbi:MAG TPA: NUDIX hydrolase [Vicinamibacteria bacterium]|nr:NUDIX hydrolase [Vicinamibacteria bacterium]
MSGPAYAEGPRVGVGAVVIHEGRALLIRRGKEPLRGRWVIPGGTVEAGETLHDALVREVREETGVTVRPGEVVLVFDRILREDGHLRYHYVIVDYLCAYVSGTPRAGTDAEAVALVRPEELPGYDIPPQALEVVLDAFRRCGVAFDAALAPGRPRE